MGNTEAMRSIKVYNATRYTTIEYASLDIKYQLFYYYLKFYSNNIN